MKTIEYFMVPGSPYTYFGHRRAIEIAARHGARLELKPFDLGGRVFPVSGGLPVGQRAPQRQAYRLVELARWSAHLGLPLNLKPKYFPVAPHEASLLIIATDLAHGTEVALRVADGVLRATWADERDISDAVTLAAIAGEAGVDAGALASQRADAQARYDLYTQQAIDRQVFGAPWFVYRDEPFWGQDRLDFLERALA
jgi:2-hydroxychromene-2-carboxylate isomerase